MIHRVRNLCQIAVTAVGVAAISGCAPARVVLPSGAGTPFAEAATAYQTAVRDCRDVRTIEVTIGLSGRAGGTRLRGNVDAGFEAPDKLRLEMRAPIGRPVFILAAPGPQATLYLPRENRVLRSARSAEVVEALVGVSIDGAELRSIVSGCGFGAADPSNGRSFDGQWLAVDTGAARTYLRQHDGQWRVTAAERSGVTVHYGGYSAGRPSNFRLQAPASNADVTGRVSDLTTNRSLQPAVFEIDVPPAAEPLTLEELRQAGPLGRQ